MSDEDENLLRKLRSASRLNRSGRTQADHDVFEGLPIRQWRLADAPVGPPPQMQPGMEKLDFPELPMPRDSHLLPEHSQQLLRAARAGRLYKPPSNAGDEEKENGEEEEEAKDVQRGFVAKKYSRTPRTLEDSEPFEYLAKRRKGLPSAHTVYSGIETSLNTAGPMRKTKVKKVDAEGNTQVYEVLVPEGQTVEGEVQPEDVSVEEPAAPVAAVPGTVVEGVGVVNADGLVVASEIIQPTPPRRRPPPPKRKTKKGGPGRAKKKVAFSNPPDGAPGALASVDGPTELGLNGPTPMKVDGNGAAGTAEGEDSMMRDAGEGGREGGGGGEGEGEGEGDEDEEDGEEGEEGEEGDEGDDEEDREEGELSPSVPAEEPQAEVETTAMQIDQEPLPPVAQPPPPAPIEPAVTLEPPAPPEPSDVPAPSPPSAAPLEPAPIDTLPSASPANSDPAFATILPPQPDPARDQSSSPDLPLVTTHSRHNSTSTSQPPPPPLPAAAVPVELAAVPPTDILPEPSPLEPPVDAASASMKEDSPPPPGPPPALSPSEVPPRPPTPPPVDPAPPVPVEPPVELPVEPPVAPPVEIPAELPVETEAPPPAAPELDLLASLEKRLEAEAGEVKPPAPEGEEEKS